MRATFIPSVAVPVSLIGTFGVMYLCGYSLDNLSLMALTISTGFVVDDAIVVIENITRYLEAGHGAVRRPRCAARARSASPCSPSASRWSRCSFRILLMGGIVGRLFREFAVTLSVAIAISLVVSLTTTPMMCAQLLQARDGRVARLALPTQRARLRRRAGWLLRAALSLGAAPSAPDARDRCSPRIGLNVYLFIIVPKGFFPAAGHRALIGRDQADQDTSFQAMHRR